MIADKIGNFKFFLSLTLAASGCAALVFSAVPVARIEHKLPDNLTLTVACGDPTGSEPVITVDKPFLCDYLENITDINIQVGNCALCGTNSSLDFIDETEIKLCEEAGPFTAECVIRNELAYVNHSLTAESVKGEDGNVTHLRVLDWTCPSVSLESIDQVMADAVKYISPEDILKTRAKNCTVRCQAFAPRDLLCSNKITEEVLEPMRTFWYYMMVRVLNSLTLATSFTLLEGAAVALVKEYNGDFGLQRLYANLGGVIITPISGQLMDYVSAQSHKQDYRPAFYLYCALKILGSVIVLFVDLDFRKPSNKVIKDLKMLIKNAEIVSFLTVVMIAGTTFGVLDTFLFWMLEDLGATKFLMGITVTVGSIAGIPILIASRCIFKKLGLANTIILGMFVYVIRMVGYSFLTNPWWCMPFESLECFTVSLLGTAAVAYAADLATPATLATLQGMFGGLHYGVGRGFGSLLGGFLLQPIGVRGTFQLVGGMCGITALIYCITNKMFFQAAQDERQRIKEEEEERKRKEMEAKNGGQELTIINAKLNGDVENGGVENGAFENGGALTDKDIEAMENAKNRESGGDIEAMKNSKTRESGGDIEAMENNKNKENGSDIEPKENAKNRENGCDTESMEKAKNKENGGDIETMENGKNKESGGDFEPKENAKNKENDSDIETMENAKNKENGSDIETTEKAKNKENDSDTEAMENAKNKENGSDIETIENDKNEENGGDIEATENAKNKENGDGKGTYNAAYVPDE